MKTCLIILMLVGCLMESPGQSNATTWVQKFNTYQAAWPKVKLHLTFNQQKYSPGDTVYFKIYFLNEDLTPIRDQHLIYINLIDSAGRASVHLIAMIHDGIGFNQIVIPETLSAGLYLITAHSNWMRNFNPAPFFQKVIPIVKENQWEAVDPPILQAAVEGGHLVNEVASKVSIRYQVEKKVQIINEAGQEYGHGTTDLNGLSAITFVPKRKESYFVQGVGESIRTALPEIKEDGISIMLQPAKDDEPIRLTIASPQASSLRTKELTVVVSAQGKIQHTTTTTVVQGDRERVTIDIPQLSLPLGVIHISVLSNTGALMASRDFYHADRSPVHAKIITSKDVFQTREKVTLNVALTDANGMPISGEFSMSILNQGLFNKQEQLVLADELTIPVARWDALKIPHDEVGLSSLDNFLILETKPLPWEEILANEIQKPRYPFTGMIERKGIVYLTDSQAPVPDFTQITFYLQQKKTRYQTFTSDKGKVTVVIPDLQGEDELFYLAQKARENELKRVNVIWEDDAIPLPKAPKAKESEHPDNYAAFFKKKRMIDYSFDVYTTPTKKRSAQLSSGNTDFENQVAQADVVVNLKDYVPFSTMEEMIKEIIPSMFYRKTGDDEIVRVSVLSPLVSNQDPLFVIDGIITRDTKFFLGLNPADLMTVRVIFNPKKLGPLGLLGKNGIVMVQSKTGNLRAPLDDLSKKITGVNPIQSFKAFVSGEGKQPFKPAYRSTLYWNPSIKTDSQGIVAVEFFGTDDVGKVSIRIDGIAEGGKPFTLVRDIEMILGPPSH